MTALKAFAGSLTNGKYNTAQVVDGYLQIMDLVIEL